MKKLMTWMRTAILAASICLLAQSLRAQDDGFPDPDPDPADAGVEFAIPPSSPDAEKINDGITIVSYAPDEPSTPEAEINAKNEDGKADKLPGLEPDQVVGVTLKFDAGKNGHVIDASALDGGQILEAENGLVVDDQGMVSFKFQVGHEPGLYQVALRDESHEMGIEFWVINNEQPAGNPKVDLPAAVEEGSDEGE